MGIFTALSQGEVMRTEPSRKAATLVGVLAMGLALGGLVALQSRRENPPAKGDLTAMPPGMLTALAWFATGILVLGFISALVNGRRWLLTRHLVRMSESGAGQSVAPADRMDRGTAAIVPHSLGTVDRVVEDWPQGSPTSVATGDKHEQRCGQTSLRIAYLRVFNNQPRARAFLQGAWREFGYVYMLRSASSVTPREYRVLRRERSQSMFVGSPETLRRALDRGEAPPDRPGRRVFRNLAPTTVRTRDNFGAYPPVTVLCHGAFWREAVDELLLRVDAVCLDLSGFSAKRKGTGYELQRVVDRFPIERVVFLMDQKSKVNFLEGAISEAWKQMGAGSPNEGSQRRRTHLVETDQLRTTVTYNEHGQETNRQSRLVAQRKQTRALAAHLQTWLDSVPPAPRAPWGAPAISEAQGPDETAYDRWPRRSMVGWVAALALAALALVGVTTAAPGLVVSGYTPVDTATGAPTRTPIQLVEVPSVEHRQLGKARKLLRQADLRWKISRIENQALENTVIRQLPNPGASVARLTVVTLLVSLGPPKPVMVTVPDLKDMSVEEARAQLTQLGLVLGKQSPRNSSQDANTVLRSHPGSWRRRRRRRNNQSRGGQRLQPRAQRLRQDRR